MPHLWFRHRFEKRFIINIFINVPFFSILHTAPNQYGCRLMQCWWCTYEKLSWLSGRWNHLRSQRSYNGAAWKLASCLGPSRGKIPVATSSRATAHTNAPFSTTPDAPPPLSKTAVWIIQHPPCKEFQRLCRPKRAVKIYAAGHWLARCKTRSFHTNPVSARVVSDTALASRHDCDLMDQVHINISPSN